MVYVFLADGFEETEAIAPIDMLRRAGKEVTTVGVTGKTVTSSHGISVIADMTEDEFTDDSTNTDDIEMIILPGGMPGTLNEEASLVVQVAIDYCAENNIPIGAICAAPSILGHKGLLNGKNAICYSGFEKELHGAVIAKDKGVVTDGNITTARGAGVAIEFGLELVKVLCGIDVRDKIKESILMD